MRVIAGQAKGRPLRAVPGRSTRPTTDKVKEAIFSIIGPYFDGERVLDLFAGTGGLGIEALSRGAGSADIYRCNSARSIEVVRHNLAAAGMTERALVYRNDATRAIKLLGKKGDAFDLIFLDPPYDIDTADALLALLVQHKLAKIMPWLSVEHASALIIRSKLPGLLGLSASYGEAAISVYRYGADAGQMREASITHEEGDMQS